MNTHTIQLNIPKVVHDCKFDKHLMFSASGYLAGCTEPQTVLGEVIWSWIFNCRYCLVSSSGVEYSTVDTVHEFTESWVLGYGHSWVSSKRVKYSAPSSSARRAPINAVVTGCFIMSQISLKWNRFWRQIAKLVDLESSSSQNSIASSTSLSSAGDIQRGSTGNAPSFPKKQTSNATCLSLLMLSQSRPCGGESRNFTTIST